MRIEIQILVFMNDGVDKMKATEFLIVLIQEAMTTKSIHLLVTAEVVTAVVDLEASLEIILKMNILPQYHSSVTAEHRT